MIFAARIERTRAVDSVNVAFFNSILLKSIINVELRTCGSIPQIPKQESEFWTLFGMEKVAESTLLCRVFKPAAPAFREA